MLCLIPTTQNLSPLPFGSFLPQSVAEDMWPFSTAIPPMLQYPTKLAAFQFVTSLVWMFYAPSWTGNVKGLFGLLKCFLPGFGRKSGTKGTKAE
jgi:hypothetical protein